MHVGLLSMQNINHNRWGQEDSAQPALLRAWTHIPVYDQSMIVETVTPREKCFCLFDLIPYAWSTDFAHRI